MQQLSFTRELDFIELNGHHLQSIDFGRYSISDIGDVISLSTSEMWGCSDGKPLKT